MENNMELNMEQMSEVSGGKNEGGYAQKPSEKSGCFIYKIKHGDTLSKIARKNGTTIKALCRLNGIKETTTLQIGRRLRVR